MQLAHLRLGDLNTKNNVLLEEVASYKKQLIESSGFGTVPLDQTLGSHALPPNVETNESSGPSNEEVSENKLKSSDPESSAVSYVVIEKLN
jgi:hypothetical protein